MLTRLVTRKILNYLLLISPLICPPLAFASFIESSIGTAVVNDATATLYNPAALTLLKNPQIIPLGSVSYFQTKFTGQATQTITNQTFSGSTSSQSHFYLPSLYYALPANDKIFVGIGIITNFFNRDIEQNSILRYAQSNNQVQDVDFVSAVGIKMNEYFSVGAGFNVSYANFLLKPTTGFPSLNIPDAQSRNDTNSIGYGADLGLLLKPSAATTMGFNYRSSVTYNMSGQSIYEGTPQVTSNNYHFRFWTPARSTFSVNQFVTKTLGFIATIQYLQWSIINNLHIHNISTPLGIVGDATVPFRLKDSWLGTLGTHYRVTPEWIIRFAATYIQSPDNPHYQISNGDNIVVGFSTGYEFTKKVIVDASYAHVFIRSQNVNITTGRNFITGVNRGSRDGVSLKVTFNL